jgi:hypothetical protein
MIRRIRTSEATLKPVRDTGASLPRVHPGQVEAASGAEAVVAQLSNSSSPSPLVRELAVRVAPALGT